MANPKSPTRSPELPLPEDPHTGRWRRPGVRALGVALLLLAASLLAFFGFASEPRVGLLAPTLFGNLREVDPGRFYRSGQLSDSQLLQTIEVLGIRTIINLRGHSTYQDWYQAEAAVAAEKDVSLHNIHLSSRGLPHRREIADLLDLYRTAERPILVHCDGGADRAGEAAAIYQIEYMGKSQAEALEMLTFRYRHLSWWKPAKRYFMERYLGEEWLRNDYDPCSDEYEYYDRVKYCGG